MIAASLSFVVLVAVGCDGFLQWLHDRDRSLLRRLYPDALVDRLDAGVYNTTPSRPSTASEQEMSSQSPFGTCQYPSDLVVQYMKSFQNSSAVLTHGLHDLDVKTHSKPAHVWLSEVDPGSMQVCQGAGNMFGVTMLETGFVIHADVRTDFTQIKWEVIF